MNVFKSKILKKKRQISVKHLKRLYVESDAKPIQSLYKTGANLMKSVYFLTDFPLKCCFK